MPAYPKLQKILASKSLDLEATNNGVSRLAQYLADAIVHSRHQGVLDEVNQSMKAMTGSDEISLVVKNGNDVYPPVQEIKNLEQDCLYALTKGWPGEWKKDHDDYIMLASCTVAALMAFGKKENNINHTATILFKHLMQDHGIEAVEKSLERGKLDGFLSPAISAVQVVLMPSNPNLSMDKGFENLQRLKDSLSTNATPSAAAVFNAVIEPYREQLTQALKKEDTSLQM